MEIQEHVNVKNPKTKINAKLDENGNVEKLFSSKKWKGNELCYTKSQMTRITESTNIDQATGEIINSSSNIEQQMKSQEPEFIKVYIADIANLKNLPKGHEQLLFELMKYCGYNGIMTLNAYNKKLIAEAIGLKPRTIDKYLSNLVDTEIIYRAAAGTYVFNPNLIARGKWSQIRKLRLMVEYDVGDNGEILDKNISTETEEVAVTECDEKVTAPRRGRPRGSKNKPKIYATDNRISISK